MENVYIILQQIYSGNSIKFHQNHQSFIGDITKNILFFFSGQSVDGIWNGGVVGMRHVMKKSQGQLSAAGQSSIGC